MLIPAVNTSNYNVAATVRTVQTDTEVRDTEKAQAAAKAPDTDTFERSSEVQEEVSTPVQTNRLSADQLRSYQDQLNQSFTKMVNDIVSNQANQGKKAAKGGLKDFFSNLTVTPEQKLAAQQAIGEDGEWGVNAVATRIMDMCVALSGGDSSKIEEMRAAVDKGFKQAMGDWGGSLPSICSQTHDEINKRFDYWKETGSLDGYQYQKAAVEE